MALALRGLALAALALVAAAGETAAPLVIVGGTVIDGTGRPPLPDGVIVIRDGKFVSVTSAGTGSLPADGRRIDAGGKWIIPGLIDMHVHYHEWMALGQGESLGTIAAGRIADLVVVAANPLRSIAAIKQIDLVVRDGRVAWTR